MNCRPRIWFAFERHVHAAWARDEMSRSRDVNETAIGSGSRFASGYLHSSEKGWEGGHLGKVPADGAASDVAKCY